MRSVIRMSGIACATLLLSLLAFASQSVQAATLTVSTTADGGAGSLRQAIIDATSNAAANTINFNIPLTDPGYSSATNRFTITLVNQLPDLPLAPLTIDNTTGRGVTVRGNSTFRIFTLVNSAVVNITNMTISHGSSSGGLGGGIYMGDSGVLFLTNCIVSNNSATNGGGGIWVNNSGTLHVINSTISNNTATNGNGGGGIYVSVSGTLNITGSTVNGNTATVGGGGGIYNGVSGTVNATNITVNGNTAGDLGGGILNNATATVSSSTISGNAATNGGGGIYNNFTATLNNSLIALNTSADGADLLGRGSRGKPFSGNSNLIGNADGSEAFGPTTNQLGSTGSPINPRLGPLRNNGGLTFTQALLAGSPAIDAGATALASDQRGVSRPQNGDGVGGAQSDIGSFESEGLPELTINDVTVAENEPTGEVRINVMRTGNTAQSASIDYLTSDNTAQLFNCDPVNYPNGEFRGIATSRCDYTLAVGTLQFAAGETSKTISVFITNDTHVDGTETFTVSLRNPTGAILGTTATATVTITDDDTTNQVPNPYSNNSFFSRQLYLDFFGRNPSDGEIATWANVMMSNCGGFTDDPSDGVCYDRTWIASKGFFQSPEFQQKGYFAYRFYKLLGITRLPFYAEFKPDMVSLTDTTDATKNRFAQQFMQRTDYLATYPASLTNEQFVDKLIQTTGLTTLNASQLKADLNSSAKTRAQVLREVAESQEMFNREFNEAWVVMHYFAFLQRDGSASEYASWKQVFDRNPNDWRTVSYGFVTSTEYKQRFGDPQR